jgi:hypothetical protein
MTLFPIATLLAPAGDLLSVTNRAVRHDPMEVLQEVGGGRVFRVN